MLSLKTASQGTSPGFHHHHPHHHGSPTSTSTSSGSGSTSDTVDQTSCCSLVDAMSTAEASTSTASSSATNGTTGSSSSGLRRKPTMKSSYALTSMLQQQQQQQPQDDEEYTKHSNSSPTLSMIPDTTTTTLASAIVADAAAMTRMSPAEFGAALHAIEQPSSQDSSTPFTESQLRKALECPLRQARKLRDNCRGPGPQTSWIGLPYPSLREERPFLYDHMHTHPLAEILQRTLNKTTTDLAQLHQTWDSTQMTALQHQRQLVAPLLDKHERTQFAHAYESFVTSCCIPLLHAAALRHSVFSTSSAGVVYRYQVFPTINIVYPNDPEACRPPSCDLAHGKSVGWLHFHIPLTAACNTSALYCERYPGREDWHALRCTSVGLGYCWDGARCHSFVPLNTTNATRVSLDFRILLVRPDSLTSQEDDELCRPLHLTDSLTRIPGFYEQATMDVGGASRILLRRRSSPWSAVPDARCGFPFA
ncbi:expressed unknown protein [Seminavis robusta]|uniref:Uncharacterized protein n=1 Tax=Seminavis robusta TaxID=568900 RepID=A0A9N8HN70_9STRA|nr:expressed unknown protein [Seminavis robusta]|eukprot:Sro963_g225310.1 n/a (478) ;mRNA; f:19294-20727